MARSTFTPAHVQTELAPKRQWDRAVIGPLDDKTLEPLPASVKWDKKTAPKGKPWEDLRTWLEMNVRRPTEVSFLQCNTDPVSKERVWCVDARMVVAPDPSKPPPPPVAGVQHEAASQRQEESTEMDRAVLDAALVRQLEDFRRVVDKAVQEVKDHIDKRLKEAAESMAGGAGDLSPESLITMFDKISGGRNQGPSADELAGLLDARLSRMGYGYPPPGYPPPGYPPPGYPPPGYPPPGYPPPGYPPPQPQYPQPQAQQAQPPQPYPPPEQK